MSSRFKILVGLFLLTLAGFAATARAESGASPVANASANSTGSIRATYAIQILNASSQRVTSEVEFPTNLIPGVYYAYIDLKSSNRSSGNLAIRYGIEWIQRPNETSVHLEDLTTSGWSDLNKSGLVLAPSQTTSSFSHKGYESSVREELDIAPRTNGTFQFILKVYGFLTNSSTSILTTLDISTSADMTQNGTSITNENRQVAPSSGGTLFSSALLIIPVAIGGIVGLIALIHGLQLRRARKSGLDSGSNSQTH